jgi:hypothetical protein
MLNESKISRQRDLPMALMDEGVVAATEQSSIA